MSRRRDFGRDDGGFGGMGGMGGSEFLSMSRFASMSFDDASSAMNRSHSQFAQAASHHGQSRSFRIQRDEPRRAIAQQRNTSDQPDAFSALLRFPQDILTALGADGSERRARSFAVRPQSTVRGRDPGFDEYQALQMLDEDVVKRGVSDRKLRGLPIRPVTRHKAGDEKCNICQFEYRDGEKVMHLPCKHQFHPDCITGWFKENRTCPVCRYEVEA